MFFWFCIVVDWHFIFKILQKKMELNGRKWNEWPTLLRFNMDSRNLREMFSSTQCSLCIKTDCVCVCVCMRFNFSASHSITLFMWDFASRCDEANSLWLTSFFCILLSPLWPLQFLTQTHNFHIRFYSKRISWVGGNGIEKIYV